jgi:uncharacterized protein (TIGR03067 family)
MRREWFVVLGAAFAFAGPARTDDAADDGKLLNGTWVIASAELAGKPMPDDFIRSVKLTIDGDQYAAKVGDLTETGTFTVDPAAKPKAMDISAKDGPHKGKKIRAVYAVSGDALKVCYALDGGDRPAEFKSTAENKFYLVTYKREKP